MNAPTQLKKVAFLSDYTPRQCGIATFADNLRNAIAGQYPELQFPVIAVNDIPGGYNYPPEVRFEIAEQELKGYRRAADFLNLANDDVLCVQHEFGIFGGANGSHLLSLLRNVRIPIVTTLHTILRDPTPEQKRILTEVIRLSARVVTMAEKGVEFLREIYDAPEDKVVLIPHGIPDVPFVDPNYYKDKFGVEGRQLLLTFGLLSPNKGIEFVLNALPAIVEEFPDLVYLVLGATHPNLVRDQGETYRLELERLAKRNGIEKNVMFFNRFVDHEELVEFLGAADIYITPYLNEKQITSGTLAYSFGSGKAVVSTPYWHAEELLANGRGVLVPFGDSTAIADAVRDLLRNETSRHAMRKNAYLAGREMIWSSVAHQYVRCFEEARHVHADVGAVAYTPPTLDRQQTGLPVWRFDHLLAITDDTGIFQHAIHTLPDYHHGYCTDDNARALILMMLLEEMAVDLPGRQGLAERYAAFLQYAFNPEAGRFRNFMSFGREWLEECGSEDSHARALWALGTCVGRSQRPSLRSWAAELFEKALPVVSEFTSPRAWAFTVIGLHEYLRTLSGDRMAEKLREELSRRMMALFKDVSGPKWCWLEDVVTYDNAKIPQALIMTGRWTNQPEMLAIGLKMLRWLTKHQTAPAGHFRPVGSNGFWKRGGKPAAFDQQPVEAHAMVCACLEAHSASGSDDWLTQAGRAFEWFDGGNDLGMALYDAQSGGCRDGLHIDRVNQNQGAESTLAFLLSLAEMQRSQNAMLIDAEKPTKTAAHD